VSADGKLEGAREQKPPLELIVKGRGDSADPETVAWACGECGVVCATETQAETCCFRRCEDCNAVVELDRKHWLVCRGCQDKRFKAREADQEEKRIAKASRVSVASYAGEFFFWEGRGSDSGFFSSYEELVDYCDHWESKLPDAVWACSPRPLRIDAQHIVEAAVCDDHHEGAYDEISSEEIDALQKLLDDWCDATGVVSYFPDYDVRVVLDTDPYIDAAS